MKCSECKEERGLQYIRRVDDKWVCNHCLYGDAAPILVYPIGLVRSSYKSGARPSKSSTSEIHLMEGMSRFMQGLSDEKYLTIIWYLDRKRTIRISLKRSNDGKTVGPFASRTPDRPSPIGVTTVELVRIEDTLIFVKGLDAYDGSPVLDIKSACDDEIQSLR